MAPARLRTLNKHIFNPVMRRLAGLPLVPHGVLYHRGRKSGKEYATPVVPWPAALNAEQDTERDTEQGFIIALFYGDDVDWLRNVLIAGECGLRWHGERYRLTQPEMLDPAQALPAYPEPFRPILRTLGTQKFLRLQRQRGRDGETPAG